jgi:uncharacterized protein (TIGR04222 family)
MLTKQQPLYQRICAYAFTDPSHEIDFLAHLMRANGWSRPFASRAIEEYRKFVFLALVADHQVTPSDQVDQVWHLHLVFSETYWNDFCPRVLGRPLHHQPTRGGQEERDRFLHLYRATIHTYRQHFGEPPLDLWPPAEVRFGRDLRMRRGPIREPLRLWHRLGSWRRWRWSGPLGMVLMVLGGVGGALSSAAAETSSPPASGPDGIFWLLASTLTAGYAWFAIHFLRPLLRQPSEGRGVPALTELELAYLARGPAGALQTALASLVQSGVLLPRAEQRSLVALGTSEAPLQDLAHQMLRVHHTLKGRSNAAVTYAQILSSGHYNFTSLEESLQSRDLLLHGVRKVIAQAPGHPVARFFCTLVLARCLVLLPEGVGLLLMPPSVGIILALSVPSGRTLWAEQVLESYRIATAHGEALARVALLGPKAMVGGRLDALRTLIEAVDADNAAGCGCGC